MDSGMAEFNETLPRRMRGWMRARKRAFSFAQIVKELNLPKGDGKYYVMRTLDAFARRGELKILEGGRVRRFIYDQGWKRGYQAPLKTRILKAMRLISFRGPFSVGDIQSMADAKERSYVDQLIRDLRTKGYLSRVGSRISRRGRGRESLFLVVDPQRFRVDLL